MTPIRVSTKENRQTVGQAENNREGGGGGGGGERE